MFTRFRSLISLLAAPLFLVFLQIVTHNGYLSIRFHYSTEGYAKVLNRPRKPSCHLIDNISAGLLQRRYRMFALNIQPLEIIIVAHHQVDV